MTTPISFPLLNGNAHGFASLEAVLQIPGGKKIQMFVKSLNYSRTRTRGQVRGNHPDPRAKTRGENEYSADMEIYLADLQMLLAEMGPGYGDVLFTVLATYGENGFDTVTDEILGCSIDSLDASQGQGPDPLMRKIDLGPLKILFGGVEDLEFPMVAPPA